MTARDELQQWVDGVDATHEDGLADLTHDVIPVDLARRVLAEMDEAKEVNRLVMSTLDRALTAVCEIAEVPDDIDDPDYPFEKLARIKAERDATLATLDAVREWAQINRTVLLNHGYTIGGDEMDNLDRILDRGQA